MEKVYGICENKCRMEVVPKSVLVTGAISTSWTGSSAPYTQTITNDNIEAGSVIEVSLSSTATAAQADAFNALQLADGGQADGSFTLRAFGTKNTVSIPINILIRRDL